MTTRSGLTGRVLKFSYGVRVPGVSKKCERWLYLCLLAVSTIFTTLGASTLQAREPETHAPRPSAAAKIHAKRGALERGALQNTGALPAVSYATYLGDPRNRINAMALGADGSLYVAGVTLAAAAAIDPTQTSSGEGIAFVARISSDGSQLIYFSNLGAGTADEARAIAVDISGNAYVTGQTRSKTFPTANALQSRCSENVSGQCTGEAFVAKLDPQGAIIYSTYLGGSGEDAGNAIAIDGAGNAYVAGSTASTDFPTFKAAQSSIGGSEDAFVAKISADGSHVLFATYMGGKGDDEARGLAVDAAGSIYVAGGTDSLDFPVHNALQSNCVLNSNSVCAGEAFVAKLSADGSGFLYSTYLGGSGGDAANAIAIDSGGGAYVSGFTNSADFPLLKPLAAHSAGGRDAFVSRLAPDGRSLVFSTYLGGSGADQANAISLDPYGNVIVSGWTASQNFPLLNPVQFSCATTPGSKSGCSVDSFVAALDATGSALKFATYFGGSGVDDSRGVTVDAQGSIFTAGTTNSVDFPDAKLLSLPNSVAGNQSASAGSATTAAVAGGAFTAKISGMNLIGSGSGGAGSNLRSNGTPLPDAPTTCTGTTTNWIGGNGNWSNAAMWSTGIVPNSSATNVCIDAGNGANSSVTLDVTASVGTLTIDSGDSLTIGNNQSLTVAGNISNAGQIQISAAANNTFMTIAGTVSLSGGGTLTLSTVGGGTAFVNQTGSGAVLVNVDNTIQGTGQIGNNGLGFVNQAGGIVNANVGSALLLLNTAAITNTGLLESSGSGTLQIASGTNNSGGTISAAGASATQFVNGTTIQGGSLSTTGTGVLGTAVGNTITLDGTTHGALTIAGTYTAPNNSSTILAGTINNTGVIQLAAAANNTFLTIAGSVNLSGGGSLIMSTVGGGTPIINQTGTGAILTNVNNTIQGRGEIGNNGLALVNQVAGIVNASTAGATMVLDCNGIANQGLLEATNGATLQTTTTVNNLNATITANGTNSTVLFLNGTTVQAGTLRTLNGGVLGTAQGHTATLDGTAHGTLTNAGTFTGANNSSTIFVGAITNPGTIQILAAANNTFLTIAGSVNLTGGGMLNLSTTAGGSAIVNQTGSNAVLTNVDNTIQGFGQIGNNGLALVNQSTINANQAAGVLLVNPVSLTNAGLLEATNGGTLQPSTTINNTGGTIKVDGSTSAMQFLNGTIIQGGTLLTTNSGVLGTAPGITITLDGVTHGALTNAGTFTAANNSSTIFVGTINNPGLIQVNAAANNTFLTVSGKVTLTGSGTVTLATSAGGAPIINQTGSGAILTNVNNTIQGRGEIGNNGLALVNQGTINASLNAATLTIDPSGTTNTGLLEATAGTLQLANSVIINSGGNISVTAAAASVQFVNGATIQGGTLTSASGGVMGVGAGTTITLDGKTLGAVTIVGTYTAANNSSTILVGTIVNTGTILISAVANNTFITVSGAVSLSGGGTVAMNTTGGGAPIINQTGSGAVLTNVSNTIQGQGQIGNNGLALVNQGTINASQNGTTLTINPSSTVNTGLLEATAGSLQLAISVVNNAGGTIKVAGAASSVQFVAGATIQGGTLATATGGVLGVAPGQTIFLDGAAQGPLTISGAYTGANNSSTILVGTINNTGAILIDAAANNTFLTVSGAVTLTGGGVVTLATTGGGSPIVNQSGSNAILTNSNNMIQGVGQIGNNGLTLVNQASGIVNANVASAVLLLNANLVTNQGLLEATNAGVLQTSTTVNNLNATITANGMNSAVQFLNGSVIQAGTLSTLNTGFLGVAQGNTITLDGAAHGPLTNAGIYSGTNNSSTILAGTINNTGAIQIAAAANNTFLTIAGGVNLNGGGTLTLSTTGGGAAIINQTGSGAILTNSGNTIQGSGQIGNNGLSIVNKGTILANTTAALVINPAALTNQGLLEAAASSTLQLANASIANTGGTIRADGVISVLAGFAVNGGIVSGAGAISGSVTLASTAAAQPGDSPLPGILMITGNGAGNYTQGPTESLNIVIGGATAGTQYSQLNLSGAANLNGTFNVTLANGFSPAAGTQFTILNAASVTGQFSAPNLPNLPSGLLWTVTYNPTSVVLVAAAPASIAVTPANPTIAANATLQFTATATFQGGGTQNVTGAVTWNSSAAAAATISPTGLATGVTAGESSTISATLGNVSGSTLLTISGSGTPALTQVSPNTGGQGQQNLSIAITGSSTHFSQASTIANFGAGITVASLTINSATSATAIVNVDPAAALGARTVTLQSGNELASLTNGFTVVARTLTSIAVTPNPAPSIAINANEQFTATGTFSDGSTQNLTGTATWASSVAGFATISNAAATRGLATGVAAGTTLITATVNGVASPGVSLTVTATGVTLTSITVAPTAASVAVNATQPFIATGHFSDGSSGAVTVTWGSSNTAIATINAAGIASGASAGGPITITATSTQTPGISGTAQLTVTAVAPTLTSITVAPATASVAINATRTFAATGHFSDGSSGAVAVDWSSSNTGIASISAAGVATGVSAGGPITITATSTQTAGISGTAQLTVTGAAPTLISITVAPASASISVGASQSFTPTGHFSDGSTAVVPVNWISSNTAVATINASGTALGISPGGPVTITATSTQSQNVSGTAQLTIIGATLVSIAVTPASPTAPAGTTLQFHATGTYADTTTKDITSTVVWSSSNSEAATIDVTGFATLVAAGQSTISATLGNLSGSTLLTVNVAPFTLTLAPPQPGQPTVPVVSPGGTVAFGLILTPVPGFDGTVQLSCTSSNPTITCSPNPSSVTLTPNSPNQVAIVLNTFCQGSSPAVRTIPVPTYPGAVSGRMTGGIALLLMSLLFGAATFSYRRRPTWALSFAVLLLIALGGAACGGLAKGPNGPTTTGPVTVTVTATANGATATAPPIELIVN